MPPGIMPSRMPLISLVIPVHNESENVLELHRVINNVLRDLLVRDLPNYDFEFIFVDDGSTDNSLAVIENLASVDARVKFLQFSRNFGKELATTAGLHVAAGDAVIMLDADFQHPPEKLPEFLSKWQQGAEVVVGVRLSNIGEGPVKRLGSQLFYWLSNLISDTKILSKGTDFSLLDRRVVNEFKKFSERARITRGLVDWLGFKRDTVEFVAPPRRAGKASYNFAKLLNLAVHSVVTHSMFPLKVAGYLGALIILVSGPLGAFVFFEKYVANDKVYNFTGPAALAVLILFLIGIVLVCLGLMALYIGNIHTEVMDRPMYIIRKSNVDHDYGKHG